LTVRFQLTEGVPPVDFVPRWKLSMIRTASFLLLLAIVLPGCGGTDTSATGLVDMGGADGNKIAFVVEDLNDSKGSGKKFNASFAKGSTPTAVEAKKFSPYQFTVVGKPTVNGSEATAKVSVQKEGDGKEIGEKEWSFVKEGDAWKIKSAPMP